MDQRIVAAVLFGLSAAIAAVQVSGIPTTKQGWLALASTFIVAAYGKYSSNTTLLAPNREQWTDERRTVEAPK